MEIELKPFAFHSLRYSAWLLKPYSQTAECSISPLPKQYVDARRPTICNGCRKDCVQCVPGKRPHTGLYWGVVQSCGNTNGHFKHILLGDFNYSDIDCKTVVSKLLHKFGTFSKLCWTLLEIIILNKFITCPLGVQGGCTLYLQIFCHLFISHPHFSGISDHDILATHSTLGPT